MENTIERWSNIDEITDHLGVSKDTVRNWIKKGEIPAHKIGNLWKFRLSEVDEWVLSGKSGFFKEDKSTNSDKPDKDN
jgi:excisionase family DNA binding protein